MEGIPSSLKRGLGFGCGGTFSNLPAHSTAAQGDAPDYPSAFVAGQPHRPAPDWATGRLGLLSAPGSSPSPTRTAALPTESSQTRHKHTARQKAPGTFRPFRPQFVVITIPQGAKGGWQSGN